MLTVLSLGKLCEENGYSNEWSSGQKPRLTKNGEEFLGKTKNFVPLVVPVLSSSSGTSSSSASPPQDSSSTSSSPATERSDEQAPGDRRDSTKSQNKNKKESNKQATGDRLRDLPEWLEEFTDNIEDTEAPVPAHVSQDSDSELPTKVVSKSRKHSSYTHFPKDRNCEVCLRTLMTRAPCKLLG